MELSPITRLTQALIKGAPAGAASRTNWLDRSGGLINFGGVPRDQIRELLAPLEALPAAGPALEAHPLLLGEDGGTDEVLPSYQFRGPTGGGDPVRIGIFAGIHGDEPAGVHASVRFLQRLAASPTLASGYHLFVYPVCNPAGFACGQRCAGSGKDLNREFWIGSCEPEVVILEAQIRRHNFHGLISLHADDTSDGLYGFVRGAVLARNLLAPALAAASRFLPRNLNPVIDGFPAHDGIIAECYDGILTSPPNLDPAPFEIILETPHRAPQQLQEEAFLAAMEVILGEYQKFLAFAANL